MRFEPYVTQVQSQLSAAAALGDDSTRVTADALATAAEPAVRLALLSVVTAAADEITAALLDSPGAPAVSVRLDGDDLRVEVRAAGRREPSADVAAASPDDSENAARISLRLPETLKAHIEATARRNGVSVNTWIVRAASAALSGSGRDGRRASIWETGTGQRLTGWING
jgi:HicB family